MLEEARFETTDEDPRDDRRTGQRSGAAAASDLIKETTTQTFVKDVIEESKRQPVLIDFWAEWCGPCRQLTPVLEKAVRNAKGKVKLVKMNIDQHPAIPGQMGIQSIPAVIAFVNGQPADGFMGALPESQVNAFIEKMTKGVTGRGEPNIAEILQEAEAVLAEGDAAAAAQIYAEVLSLDATNIAALAGLAKCYVTTGAIDQAKQTLDDGSGIQAQRRRGEGRAGCDRSRRAGAVGRPGRRAGTEGRGKPARPSGAIRSRDRAERDGQARARRPTICSRSSSATANGTMTARASSWCSSSKRGAVPMRRPSRDASGCRRSCSREQRADDLIGKLLPIFPDHALTEPSGRLMPINAEYRGPADLPEVIPVFPLPGALLLPRGQMPLNIFEPRYLAMVDDTFRDGHRLIGMIQPDVTHSHNEERPALFRVGCVGRITQLAESGDGRYILELTGVSRFKVVEEMTVLTAYRQCKVDYFPFIDDFTARKGEDAVDREALLEVLTDFLKANNLKVDWEGVESAPNEALVNALAMMSPYGPAEKQAMLEAPDLKTRAEILIAVTEMDLAKKRTSGDPPLQ